MIDRSNIADGASYSPRSISQPVVRAGEFCFAVAYLDHGHIYGQTDGLLDAGGTLLGVFEPDAEKLQPFLKKYGDVPVVSSFDELLNDSRLHLIASAAIPNRRSSIGAQVLKAGKDYFSDKSPFTTLQQLKEIRQVCQTTGQKYWVYYSERIHNEAAWHAGELIADDAIGRVLHVTNLAPHRLSKSTRPDWFFQKQKYGGIITDIGSHQAEQFLTYCRAASGRVSYARVANLENPDRPQLEDFGEFSISADNGASFFARVDWFTADGSEVWGDGRSFIVGTSGSMELRKYIDPGRQVPASMIVLTDNSSTRLIDCKDRIGFPFFGQLILDILNVTDKAMTQDHIFMAAQLSLEAQALADADKQRNNAGCE